MASQGAAVALRRHTVDTLTAAGHLGVLGWQGDRFARVCLKSKSMLVYHRAEHLQRQPDL